MKIISRSTITLIALLVLFAALAHWGRSSFIVAGHPEAVQQPIHAESAGKPAKVVDRVIQTMATISGAIRYNANPIAGITVEARWTGGGQTMVTASDGLYSFSGVPTGSYVGILVRPPVAQRLIYLNWSTDNLAGDVAKDFDLEDGFLLTGALRRPDGSPYKGFAPEIIPIEERLARGESLAMEKDIDGTFNAVLPPGFHALLTTPEMVPYFMPHTIFDLRSGDLTGQTITLLDRPAPLPVTPPVASLIQVNPVGVEGFATVTGAAGSVAPAAAVAVINLNAHTLRVTVSDTAGGFSLDGLYAPPGSSLLVKYDPAGDQVASAWRRSHTENLPGDGTLNSLPGAILYVEPPPMGDSTAQAFHSVGAWIKEAGSPVPTRPLSYGSAAVGSIPPEAAAGWAGWWISGTLQVPGGSGSGLSIQAGQPVTLTARLRVTSPAIACTEPLTYTPAIHPYLLAQFDVAGHVEPWGVWFTPYLFTPTGLPIEREALGQRMPLGPAVDFTGLTCISPTAFEAHLEATLPTPFVMEEGVYLPTANVDSGGVPLSPMPILPVWYHYLQLPMPPLRVGSPSPPRIPWTLLGDYPINGHRGLLAREDAGSFAMPTRVVHPPHHVVIPRLDERTGEPLRYQLEPGSNWIASTDRRQPNPPYIPFALPSGVLAVEVLKPDESVDLLGPAPIQQSSVRTPTTPGGAQLNFGTGHIGDIYRLTTLDDAFAYSFEQYGPHVIMVHGEVVDLYGSSYEIQGTYDVTVARLLDLDPAQLPTTPYQQGNAFAPGLHIFPPVPADVTVELVQMPDSNPDQAIVNTIAGQANRFGYFQPPPGTVITMTAPGEFRVDISATYQDPSGTLWMGTATWGNVVEGATSRILAHGKRGMDSPVLGPPWFTVNTLPPDQKAVHVFYPYFGGDVHWGSEDQPPGDTIQAIVSIEDLTGNEAIYDIIRDHATRPHAYLEGDLETMLAANEAPLFTTSSGTRDPSFAPEDIDLLAYWYGSSEKPDVHVRETISIGNMPTAYWRFDDTYGYQIGVAANGDQPGDIKWEFGGAVFRVFSETNPINEYSIYSSLWTLLPLQDPVGPRVTPPFQDATGASINGGPILQLLGEDIDMLFLPKGVRPGAVLEVGDTIAFSGHVGPPLNSRVNVTITSPSGTAHPAVMRANKIGWLYDPSLDFPAYEAGRWTVDVHVLHDQPLAYAAAPTTHNSGTVLGTSGRYEFYVVGAASPELLVSSPRPGFITWPSGSVEPIHIRGIAPAGTTAVHYTIHAKGVVMGQGSVTPAASGHFNVIYDAKALHSDFSMLSLTAREGVWEGLADEVSIHLLALGEEPRANTVTLIGEEVFVGGDPLSGVLYLPVALKPE
jgi:hypothetical protein